MDRTLSSLMDAAERGDSSAADALFSALYSELRRLAKRELARQGVPMTLSATTLVHQAYIEIAAKDGVCFVDRARFMGYAARVMRGLIIDYARSRSAQKRGGQFEITSAGTEVENAADDRELVRISEALDELAKAEPLLAEIVDPEVPFVAGLCHAQCPTEQINSSPSQREDFTNPQSGHCRKNNDRAKRFVTRSYESSNFFCRKKPVRTF